MRCCGRSTHALIADKGDAYRFALSGSSARKLRRQDVDMLAGRVFERRFFPLTGKDLGSFDRFLEAAAVMNGQIANVAGLARVAGVAHTTVKRFFSVRVLPFSTFARRLLEDGVIA